MGSGAVQEILTHYLGAVAKQQIEKRMEAKIPDILAGMLAKGMVYPPLPLDLVTRDALFRLIHVVIPSGDVSDLLRDRSESAIKPKVAARVTPETGMAGIVKITMEELLKAWFGS